MPFLEVFVILSFPLGSLDLVFVPIPSVLPFKFPYFAPLFANPGVDKDRVVIAGMRGRITILTIHRGVHIGTVREDECTQFAESLANGGSRQWTPAMHIRDPKARLPRATRKVKSIRQASLLDLVVMVDESPNV